MTTLTIMALVLGVLVLLAIIAFVALKIYACVIIRNGKWLDTNRPALVEWLLDRLI